MKPQYYAITEGVLYAGEYPGAKQPELAVERLRQLVAVGIRTFIDLTTPADGLAPYEGLLNPLRAETGAPLRRIAMPIPDMGIPESVEIMRAILIAIREAIATAPAVYLHCWGGIGRTGTVAGCWLREGGLGPEQALAQVQHLYSSTMPKVSCHPESPQTPAQKHYVRSWQPDFSP